MLGIRDIPGYEGIYEAHADGSIWSKERFINQVRNNKKCLIHLKDKKMKLVIHVSKYDSKRKDALVTLRNGKHIKTFKVCRLIASVFIMNPINLPEVNHINGNPLDNRVDNLEWCTRKYNINHAFDNGLHDNNKQVIITESNGEKHTLRSLVKASEFIGKKRSYLQQMLSKHPGCRQVEGYKFRFIDEPEDTKGDYVIKRQRKEIILTLKDGVKRCFRTYASLAKFLNRSPAFVTKYLQNDNTGFINDYKYELGD